MRQIAEHHCAAHDATCEFEFVRNYPPTVNSRARSRICAQDHDWHRGRRACGGPEPTMGAEDFAYMLQAKPGAVLLHRQRRRCPPQMGHGGGPCMLHNPSYDFNDDLIPLGSTYWVKLAEEWLAQPARAA